MNDFDIISVYTRAQAIEDGVLVDVSDAAREVGIKFPLAMTHAAWALCVELSPAAKEAMNDERGRLHDVVWMLRYAISRAPAGASRLHFELDCVTESVTPSRIVLKAECGPGDNAEPTLTVMLPSED